MTGKGIWEFAPKKILGQAISFTGGRMAKSLWDGVKPIQGVEAAHVGLGIELVTSITSKKPTSRWSNPNMFANAMWLPAPTESGWGFIGESNIPLTLVLGGLILISEGTKSG